MAAPLGFKTFVTGDVLTAADTNGYLMQGVWVFASAAARDAAVTSPQEGNMCYLKDTNTVQYYSGSAWTAVAATSGFVGCALYRSGIATIPNATNTIIGWDSERFDTNTFHDTVTNNSRITIPSGYAGKYLITYQWGYNSNTNGYRELQLLLNGTQFPQSYNLVTYNGYAQQSSALVYSLSVGDYIQLQVNQNSGGSLDASNTQSFFSVVYLGV